MNKNYFIQFEWQADKYEKTQMEERFYVPTPVMAINHFHRTMQRKRLMPEYGKIALRPKLKPAEYKMLRMFNRYSDATGNTVESDFDLPNSPNPDVNIKTKKPTIEEFNFDEPAATIA